MEITVVSEHKDRPIKGTQKINPGTNSGFPGGSGVENLPANAGDLGSSPVPDRLRGKEL